MKKLPEPFLRGLGLSDTRYMNVPAVRIPFSDLTGRSVISVQYRVAVDGPNRLRWKHGCSRALYGLNRLVKPIERITIVEGTSDCHTLWWYGEPAIGVPSGSIGSALAGELAQILVCATHVYAVREPDRVGAGLIETLARTSLRERLRVIDLAPFKDPSAMHIADPAAFLALWAAALRRASGIATCAIAKGGADATTGPQAVALPTTGDHPVGAVRGS